MEAVKLDDVEKKANVRKVLFDTFCQQYQSMAQFIQKMGFHPDFTSKISFYMDSAFLWAKEAFLLQEAEARKAELTAVQDEPVADTAEVAATD